MKQYFQVDKMLFWLTAILVATGILVFLSASFSAFGDTEKFKGLLVSQLALGLGGGIIFFFIMLRVPYEFWQKHALWLYGFGVLLLVLVLIPGVGQTHGGAQRWINLGPISLQPVEIIKYATVIYLAAWLAAMKQKIQSMTQGLIPFGIIIGIVGVLLLLQPDTDSFFIIALAGTVLYFIAGAPWKHIGIMALLGVVAFGGILMVRPYVLDRILVFVNPDRDAQGSSYQVQQQLIAVGSGQITGRGFGQSIQKFKYLPEPLSDSIFAVVGEEFGFIGSVVIIMLYLLFFLRAIWVAIRIRDPFGKLTIIGIASLIVFQSFLNIASNLAVMPLGGLPLIFMSHGGTALACALGAMGLVLNISKKRV